MIKTKSLLSALQRHGFEIYIGTKNQIHARGALYELQVIDQHGRCLCGTKKIQALPEPIERFTPWSYHKTIKSVIATLAKSE